MEESLMRVEDIINNCEEIAEIKKGELVCKIIYKPETGKKLEQLFELEGPSVFAKREYILV